MKICIITPDYPDNRISKYPFVEQLAVEMARQGHCVCVVAPYWINRRKRLYSYKEQKTINNGKLTVLRPHYISLSNKIKVGGEDISSRLKTIAVNFSLRHLPFVPDVIYGHFWESAWRGYEYAYKKQIPLFVACGESNLSKMFPRREDHQKMIDYISGVVCVSTKAKDDTVKLGFADETKCKVFPNAVDTKLFHQRSKEECRKNLGLPVEEYIIAFVGWFDNRKGSKRLAEALQSIEDSNVYSIFIGCSTDSSEYEPDCNGILFKGKVMHDKVPEYLGAADIFVLPTLNEGCSNAVIEAMACGLPVISSNLPFNWDVLNESNSILIDPNSVEEIAAAITRLKDDGELLQKLKDGATEMAKSLTIDKRIKNIVNFIQSQI